MALQVRAIPFRSLRDHNLSVADAPLLARSGAGRLPAMRFGWSITVVCTVALSGCGSSGAAQSLRVGAQPRYLSESVTGNHGVLKLCSPRTGREVRGIRSFPVTAGRTPSPLTLTANGDAVSPDGRTAFAVSVGRSGMMIARVPTGGGRPSVIAAGAQPSISPNGRILAYGTGRSGKVLAVRDLASGRTRSIDLARWIGHGNLEPGGVGNGSMTWLSNNTDVAVIPDEGIFWDLVGRRPHPPKNPCSNKQGETTCVLVVHTGGSSSQPLRVTRYVLAVGVQDLRTLGADQANPRALLAASFPLVVERIELNTPTATITPLVTTLGNGLADAFDPSGTELLYQGGHPSEIRELHVPTNPTSTPSQTALGNSCGAPQAW
jgi:hypothetical protein